MAETDQLIPAYSSMSQDQHTSTFQFEDEDYMPERLKIHEMCNASIQSSLGIIVIHLTK